MGLRSIRKGFIDTDRGQLHYKVYGEGDAIILLQILPFSTQLLDGLLIAMGRSGYRAHAVDLMGYGHSDPRDRVWEVEDFAANLEQAVDKLGIDPIGIVAGHFTGMVAVQLALTAPQRAPRLVLDGVPLWSRAVAAERLANQKPAEILSMDGVALLDRWRGVMALLTRFDPAFALTPQTQARAFAAFSHFVDIGLGPDATGAIMRYDMEAALQKLDRPVLVIGSPTDTLRESHERAVKLIGGARGHLFETVHPLYSLAPSDRSEEYLAVIEPFLRPALARGMGKSEARP